jgi:hypothetical protein
LSGLVPNKDKCVWSPSQQLEWLGFHWDLNKCLLSVPNRKLSDLYELIILVLENSTTVSQNFSYRCIFSVLNLKDNWNQIININYHNDCIRELVFWKLNIFDFKPASLLEKTSNFDIFTDASDSGAAGFIQNTTFVMHKSWSEVEAVKSSTWRELKAIEFYTDNQNAAGIVLKGSKIYELQMIALSIFNTCMSNEIDIHTVWIPRIENQSRFSQSYY